jgi:hypothetical protein
MTSIKSSLLNHIRLRRRKTRRNGDPRIAVQQLDAVADARLLGAELAKELKSLATEERKAVTPEERARIQVAVVTKLYEGGRLSYEEHAFLAVRPVISVFEDRWLDDAYSAEVAPLNRRMEDLACLSFNEESERWLSEASAREYAKLEAEVEAILNRKEVEVLHEFGLTELADLREHQPEVYQRVIERGRRASFHPEAQVHALRDAIATMQEEAELAGTAGAYSLGAAAYGAAIEGMLALRCMRAPRKSRKLATAISAKKQPPSPLRWSFDLLIDVCEAAGWLPRFATEEIGHSTAGWAHYLRELRNRIHPTRTVREHPWVTLGQRDFETARAVHDIVVAALRNRRSLPAQPQQFDP